MFDGNGDFTVHSVSGGTHLDSDATDAITYAGPYGNT